MLEQINLSELFTTKILPILYNLLVVLVAYVVLRAVLNRISSYTAKTIKKAQESEDEEKAKSVVTSMTLLRSTLRFVGYFILAIVILNQFGFGNLVSNVLLTAGIGTLAISLSAQSALTDIINGVFLLFERQFAVGDRVKINEYEGVVTAITLRVTYLDVWGKKVIIPNGQIKSVENYAGKYTFTRIVIPTPYEEDSEKMIALLSEIVEEYHKENKSLFAAKPEVVGICNFNDSSVDIQINAKCKPLKHWDVERGIRLAVKKKFDQMSISIPYAHVVISKE